MYDSDINLEQTAHLGEMLAGFPQEKLLKKGLLKPRILEYGVPALAGGLLILQSVSKYPLARSETAVHRHFGVWSPGFSRWGVNPSKRLKISSGPERNRSSPAFWSMESRL